MTQRVIVSVLLLLFCGSGAAEPTNKTVAIHAAAVPKDVKTTPLQADPQIGSSVPSPHRRRLLSGQLARMREAASLEVCPYRSTAPNGR